MWGWLVLWIVAVTLGALILGCYGLVFSDGHTEGLLGSKLAFLGLVGAIGAFQFEGFLKAKTAKKGPRVQSDPSVLRLQMNALWNIYAAAVFLLVSCIFDVVLLLAPSKALWIRVASTGSFAGSFLPFIVVVVLYFQSLWIETNALPRRSYLDPSALEASARETGEKLKMFEETFSPVMKPLEVRPKQQETMERRPRVDTEGAKRRLNDRQEPG